MRWRERRQRLDQTSLCTRSEVRVHVRALLGSMPELGLHGLDGMAAGDRLACDRVAPERLVTQRAKAKNPLHLSGRPYMSYRRLAVVGARAKSSAASAE